MDERTRRLWAASEAPAFGWGGISLVAKATGLSYKTIRAGIRECKELSLIPATADSLQEPLPARCPNAGDRPYPAARRRAETDRSQRSGHRARIRAPPRK